jgi:hypothetical protein
MSILIIISFTLSLIPALLFAANLSAYARLPYPASGQRFPAISVLIPARNEEAAIPASVSSVLASRGLEFEVIVLDDHSQDATAAIVNELAEGDDRVRLVSAPELPPDWCGKQHACWVLAQEARHPLLVFLDADVRVAPDALSRMAAFLGDSGADLASGIPQQETVGTLEKLLIPLIHFVLLCFLPIAKMRRSIHPSFAAGCGQLFIARREAYERSSGHSAIRGTLHDGIKLPRAFRAAGFKTDLFDATDLAVCRMYRTSREVWLGLAKNAGEALASRPLIGPMTLVLLGGQVLPLVLLCLALVVWPGPWPTWQLVLAIIATAASYSPRLAAAVRFRQSLPGALLHPVGILLLVSIQWFALLRNALGRPSTWRGRRYPTASVRSQTRSHRELEPTSGPVRVGS